MLIVKLLINAAALYFSTWLVPGVSIENYWKAILVVIVLALLNVFVKPILKFISFPITILSLGLFALVINTLIILICSFIIGSFKVDGFVSAFLFSIVYSVISWIIGLILPKN